MKSVELNLNKRLLIVEYADEREAEIDFQTHQAFSEADKKAVCIGSELTEEVAVEFSKPVKSSHGEDGFINYLYESKEIVYSPAFVTAIESFISAIESAGYHWGENPVKEVKVDDYYFYEDHGEFGKERLWDGGAYHQDLKEWQEAESRTFTPEKCIIFEIL